MIVLIAKYHVTPGNTDQVLSELRRMKPLVAANEPGCVFYQVSRSAEDPDLVLLYEHYVDDAALQAHRETPHFKEIVESVIMPLLRKRERELFSLVID